MTIYTTSAEQYALSSTKIAGVFACFLHIFILHKFMQRFWMFFNISIICVGWLLGNIIITSFLVEVAIGQTPTRAENTHLVNPAESTPS